MQFSILAVFTLAAAVSAAAVSQNEGFEVVVKRQEAAAQEDVPVNLPAMTDASGKVLPFDASKVYLDASANAQ